MSVSEGHFARASVLVALAVLAVGPGCGGSGSGPDERPRGDDPAASPHAVPNVEPVRARIVHEGISVAIDLRPMNPERARITAHEAARVEIRIADAATGKGLSGVYPAGWMRRRPEGEAAPDARSCQQLVEGFVAASLFSEPDVDLNTYTVLVLNDNATINVVDPRFGFGGTKLLTQIPIAGPGYDWALNRDQSRLFVTIPDAGELVEIETFDYQPSARMDVGEHAGRLLLQPDEHYAWVAGGNGVSAIDLAEHRVVASLETGSGPHDLAFGDEGRFLFVSNRAAHTVTVIDTRELAVHGTLATGWEPTSIAWSSLAELLYVSNRGQGTLSLIDPETPSIVDTITAEPGIAEIRFAPDGRFGYLVNPTRNLLHIIDASQAQIIQTGEVDGAPDEIAFSTGLAYVKHAKSDTIYMLPLGEVPSSPSTDEAAPLQIVDFPAGQYPLGFRTSPASSIVRAPGHNAVLIAHPIDQAVYYYKEGMAAPMGQFSNYRLAARAVLTVDRSLRELGERGDYETVARLAEPGIYDLAVFVDSPRIIHCFEVAVDRNPELEQAVAPTIRAEWTVPDHPAALGEPLRFEVSLLDPANESPITNLESVEFTVVRPPGAWRMRVPASPGEPGHYSGSFTPALTGSHEITVFVDRGEGREAAGGVGVQVGP